jgi:4-amino-4-deoxy-L-arabinose transferase-like glycosyltransferase
MVATNVLFFQMGHMAVVDMTLTAAVTLALGLAFLVLVERPFRSFWAPWFWLSLGLAFLAKGVFGPALVLAPLSLVLAVRGDRASPSAFLRPNWGMAASLLLVTGWAAALAHLGGREFLTEVFLRNTLGRFLASPAWVPRTGRLGEHVEPFGFYLLRTPGNLLPWVAIWAGALAATFPWRPGQLQDARRSFLPVVFAVDLLLLSLSKGKRMVYLLPVLPITFVHGALWLDLQMPKGRARAPALVLAVLGSTVLLAGLLGVAFPWVVVARVGMHPALALLLALPPAALTVTALALLRQRRLPRVLDLAMAQWTLFLVLFLGIGVPELDREWRPILEPFQLARRLESRGARVYEGRLSETQLGYASLEFQHVLPSAASPAAVRAALAEPWPVALLLETKFYWREELQPTLGEVMAVRTVAGGDRKLWDRAPTLVVNEQAAALLKPQGE